MHAQPENGTALEAFVERPDVDPQAVEVVPGLDKARVEATSPREPPLERWLRSLPGVVEETTRQIVTDRERSLSEETEGQLDLSDRQRSEEQIAPHRGD